MWITSYLNANLDIFKLIKLTSSSHYSIYTTEPFHVIVTIFFAKHVFQSYTKEPNLISHHRILRYHKNSKQNKPVNQKRLSKENQASKQLSLSSSS